MLRLASSDQVLWDDCWLNPQLMKIALAQFSVEQGNPEANISKIETYNSQAVEVSANVLFLPEMCTSGFGWEHNRKLLDSSETVVKEISRMAQSNQIEICGSFLEKTETGNAANTLFYFGRQGEVLAKYRKVHLFTLFHEDEHLESGREVVVSTTGMGRVGCSICYDLRFPELFRKCAVMGAEIQVLSAAFPHPRLEHWRTLIRARAIENQSFFIATNQCGCEGLENQPGEIHYFGHSMVVDPQGQILMEAGEEPGLLTAEIDLSKVADTRKRLTAIADRKPELY